MEIPVNHQEHEKRLAHIREELANWNQEIKDAKEKRLAMRPRRGTVHPEVMREVRKLVIRGQQITAVLIAKKTHYGIRAVERSLKRMAGVGFLDRARNDVRDEKGHIKTYYDYKLTKLGNDWDFKTIPFYPNHPDKTLELMEKQTKYKEQIYREVRREKIQEWKAKNQGKSKDQGKNPTYHLSSQMIVIDNYSLIREQLSISKSFPNVKDLETVEKRIAAVYSDFLIRKEMERRGLDYDSPEKANIKLFHDAKMKVNYGALRLIKTVLDKRLVLPGMMGDGWNQWAGEVCRCLDMRLRKVSERIYPGHFCSDSLFDNWWIDHCRQNGIPYHDEIENIEDVPGFKPFPGEKARFEKQKRKERAEEQDDEMDVWLDECGTVDHRDREEDEESSRERIERRCGPIDYSHLGE